MGATGWHGTGDGDGGNGDGSDGGGSDGGGSEGGGSNGSGDHPGARGHEGDGHLEARVTALEGALLALARELRTRRLVVVDATGTARMVAEVVDGTAELRLTTATGRRDRDAAVVIHAGGGADRSLEGGLAGLDGLVGVQLWAGGDAISELDAWPGSDGVWRPHLHLGGPS